MSIEGIWLDVDSSGRSRLTLSLERQSDGRRDAEYFRVQRAIIMPRIHIAHHKFRIKRNASHFFFVIVKQRAKSTRRIKIQ